MDAPLSSAVSDDINVESDSEVDSQEEECDDQINHTTQRYEAERERALTQLEDALKSMDIVVLRAAITRGRRFRLAGLDEAAKILRKAEKKSTKQRQAEKRRGVPPPPRSAPAASSIVASTEPQKTKKKKYYVEKQRKTLCRMHALNAFFQRAKFSEDSFMHLCREFEKSTGTSRGSSDFFYVETNGANLLSFAVERDRRYRTVYSPPGTQAEMDDFDPDIIIGYFEFDNGHVWYVLYDRPQWIVLDSRTGHPDRVKRPGFRREFGQIFVMRLPHTDPEEVERLKSISRVAEP